MKRYSTSLATRKIQIRITVKCYYHMLIKMAKVKIMIIPIAGKDAETVNQLYTTDRNVKWNIHT